MRKQVALILTIIAIVAFTVVLNVGNVSALPATVTASPNPVTAGTTVTLTGSGYGSLSFVTAFVFHDNTGLCSGAFDVFVIAITGTGTLTPSSFSTAGLSSGTHCILVTQLSPPQGNGATLASTVLTVNAAVIPEYPFGLPLLAILTVIAYGVIRRRARN